MHEKNDIYVPMNTEVYPCSYPVPNNGTVDGYPVKNATCTFCDEICEAPSIDSSIGFFDGLNIVQIIIYYSISIVFTILWQIY